MLSTISTSTTAVQFFDSIVASIPPCHGGDRGSIPRQRSSSKFKKFFFFSKIPVCIYSDRAIPRQRIFLKFFKLQNNKNLKITKKDFLKLRIIRRLGGLGLR